jgi:3-phenylpropionate/trans-cinnamate dioxygenase ferredoxin reductase subunit
MLSYTYLIVGGGMTADSAIRGIRGADPGGTIGLIAAEPEPPYDRPPLSKGLWKGKPLESIWRPSPVPGVMYHLGRTVRAMDPGGKTVTDHEGTVYGYQKLLLATGGTPRRLPSGNDQIIYFRTVDDYRRLRTLCAQAERFAVIGGGFIGSEIAAALAASGKQVVMLFPEAGIGGRVFPPDLAAFLNGFYRQKGVEVLPGELVVGVETGQGRSVVKTRNAHNHREREITVDAVVAGMGIRPNVELAKGAGLQTDDGILVDRSLRTSRADVYAAGDVASFYNPQLDKRLRVEHEDNANTMGQAAGRAMAGQDVQYDHLPFFYSDLFELGYEAVGEVDFQLDTEADWKQPYREGVVYYLREGRVRGVLLWNVWGQVDAARRLIAEAHPLRREEIGELLPA